MQHQGKRDYYHLGGVNSLIYRYAWSKEVCVEGGWVPQLITQGWERWDILTGEEESSKLTRKDCESWCSQVFLPAMLRKPSLKAQLWAWPLPLCQLLIKTNCPRSYPGHSTWSPGACGDLVQNERVIMEHSVKTDTHTWHGNQQPYKDKLETTVSCQPPH